MTGSVSQLTGVVHLDLDVHIAEVVPVPPHPEEAPHLVTLGHGDLVPEVVGELLPVGGRLAGGGRELHHAVAQAEHHVKVAYQSLEHGLE